MPAVERNLIQHAGAGRADEAVDALDSWERIATAAASDDIEDLCDHLPPEWDACDVHVAFDPHNAQDRPARALARFLLFANHQQRKALFDALRSRSDLRRYQFTWRPLLRRSLHHPERRSTLAPQIALIAPRRIGRPSARRRRERTAPSRGDPDGEPGEPPAARTPGRYTYAVLPREARS